MIAAALAALLLGCSGWGAPDCATSAEVLATSAEGPLTCGEATGALLYADLLGLRDLQAGDRRLMLAAIAAGWRSDPAATRAALDASGALATKLLATEGPAAAVLRAEEAFELHQGRGAFAKLPDVRTVVDRSVSVWEQDEQERLVLTEMDIEGWIRYASLARQAQGADAMRVSIADRVQFYTIVRDRFTSGTRAEQEALLAVGAFWPAMRSRWDAAPYEAQQAWIAAAPLPPPMMSTSLGYFEAILDADVRAHARAVHQALGPLQLEKAS